MISAPAPDHTADDLPLCVDLDGTLVTADTLVEAALSVILRDWRVVLQLPFWLTHGKARLKQELAARWQFSPEHLPYNQPLLAYLAKERERGRRLVLATAADAQIAQRIANHLGLFDEVLGSDGVRNLRGQAKADALCKIFGQKGFVYVGNDSSDHAVWKCAAAVVLANASTAVRRSAVRRYSVAGDFTQRSSKAWAIARALRPYQWVKNLLTIVPLLASGDFANTGAWIRTAAVFAAFCAVASAIYVVNDLADLGADRKHPRKSRRPFASGALSIIDGVALLPLLLVVGIWLGAFSDAAMPLVAYGVTSVAYSLKLKELPLIDVFVLAALYTVRLYAGGEASGHAVSLWLLGFSSFLFLSLALIKRVSELMQAQATRSGDPGRRGYILHDLPMLQMMGCAASFVSALVLTLYIQSDIASRTYARPTVLWGIVPLMLFWECRLWLSTSRGYMHDDPIVYAARDWVSWLVLLCLAVLVLSAYAPPGFLQ